MELSSREVLQGCVKLCPVSSCSWSKWNRSFRVSVTSKITSPGFFFSLPLGLVYLSNQKQMTPGPPEGNQWSYFCY